MTPQLEIILTASVVAMSCTLVGVFLVVRKLSMISDAISHTVLLGIIIVFLITGNIASPFMFVGAVIAGLITVYAIQAIQSTGKVSEEASVGIVFPFLFSIAIILISKYAGSVHLDTDAVLLGELAFTPLNRAEILGLNLPKALINGMFVLSLNSITIIGLYKELKLTSFDHILGFTLGFKPLLLTSILMALVSITSVASFNAVGSVLVIAFMIGPPLTANLITHKFPKLIAFSLVISVMNVIMGYQFAHYFDVSIAGSMAFVTGLVFTFTYLFSKDSGYITTKFRKHSQRLKFGRYIILFLLQEHEELNFKEIQTTTKWPESKILKIVDQLKDQEFIFNYEGTYKLTQAGHEYINRIEKDI